jgi:transposase-like protein
MPHQIKVRAYLPWWFCAYVRSVELFAYMAGLEVDRDVIHRQAKQVTRYREIE